MQDLLAIMLLSECAVTWGLTTMDAPGTFQFVGPPLHVSSHWGSCIPLATQIVFCGRRLHHPGPNEHTLLLQ